MEKDYWSTIGYRVMCGVGPKRIHAMETVLEKEKEETLGFLSLLRYL